MNFSTSNYILVSIIVMLKMDQLITKIYSSQALLWRRESLILLSNLEIISYPQFILRHVHIETILAIIIIFLTQILIQITKESLLLHGLLTKYKMVPIIFLCIIFSIHID